MSSSSSQPTQTTRRRAGSLANPQAENNTTKNQKEETAINSNLPSVNYVDIPSLQEIEKMTESLIGPSLVRLTEGIPRHELKLIAKEAKECEDALLKEIGILEEALGMKKKRTSDEISSEADNNSNAPPKATSTPVPPAAGWGYDTMRGLNYHSDVNAMLTSELAPPDKFYTVSALLGRLRQPLNEGLLPPNSSRVSKQQHKQPKKAGSSDSQKKSSSKTKQNENSLSNKDNANNPGNSADDQETKLHQKRMEKQKALLALDKMASYRRNVMGNSSTSLLSMWKKMSSHRSATVFRRPVNAREAPSYADKILFPIDLSLIRKMITLGKILSYADLHRRIGLMCHNCVKFNGRESDYGIITREFESYADDCILAAVTLAEEVLNRDTVAVTSNPNVRPQHPSVPSSSSGGGGGRVGNHGGSLGSSSQKIVLK